MIVRPERPGERQTIVDVVVAAFGTPAEGALVDRLRASGCWRDGLSLVAEAEGELVGHVLVTTAWLDEVGGREVASLAPLAVVPAWQRRGVGTALLHAVLAVCDDRSEPCVVLQGAPAYYARVGFEPASTYGISMDLPDWADPSAAQVRRLSAWDPSVRGAVIYPPAFDDLPE